MLIQGYAEGPAEFLNGNLREQHHSREKATCARQQALWGVCAWSRDAWSRWDGNIGANLELLQKHSSEGLWPKEHC